MGLVHEKVVGEVPDVDRFDVLGIDGLVHRGEHLLIGFGKEILRIAVFEQPQFGQAAADHRHPARKFSLLSHLALQAERLERTECTRGFPCSLCPIFKGRINPSSPPRFLRGDHQIDPSPPRMAE